MNSKDIDWVIHMVDMDDDKNKALGNSHTHGLDHHDHKELCIVLNLEPQLIGGVLNAMGAMIASKGVQFTDGIRSDVLQGKYDIEIKSLTGDPVLYVILPDENNRMPSDKDCSYPYNMQYEYMKLVSEYTKSMDL